MFKSKKKRFVALEVNEYVLRAIIWNGGSIEQAQVKERLIPFGIMEGDIVKDEMAFFELLKDAVKEWGIKRYDVRFFAPDSAVMMKSFVHPKEMDNIQLKGYVQMELGRSIHLPFSQPLIDVFDDKPNDGEATLFAAPYEEVNKLSELFSDSSLHPVIADIRSLSTIRFLEKNNCFTEKKSYLIADWSISGVSISIYTSGKLEFLRYQSLDNDWSKWNIRQNNDELEMFYENDIEEYRNQIIDQIAEIDRILNFYRFSLYKGEKAVDEIIVLGDSPEIPFIKKELRANYTTPIKDVGTEIFPTIQGKFIPLLGLALKEAK